MAREVYVQTVAAWSITAAARIGGNRFFNESEMRSFHSRTADTGFQVRDVAWLAMSNQFHGSQGPEAREYFVVRVDMRTGNVEYAERPDRDAGERGAMHTYESMAAARRRAQKLAEEAARALEAEAQQ